jgi:hypothetical protein
VAFGPPDHPRFAGEAYYCVGVSCAVALTSQVVARAVSLGTAAATTVPSLLLLALPSQMMTTPMPQLMRMTELSTERLYTKHEDSSKADWLKPMSSIGRTYVHCSVDALSICVHLMPFSVI